jgi:hypothetical protein
LYYIFLGGLSHKPIGNGLVKSVTDQCPISNGLLKSVTDRCRIGNGL